MTAGRSAGRPAGRRTSVGRRWVPVPTGPTLVHTTHPLRREVVGACLLPSPCTWRWNTLLSFGRGQLIFMYVVGRVQLTNISKDELNPSNIYIIIGHYNYIIVLIQNEVWLRPAPNLRLGGPWGMDRGLKRWLFKSLGCHS